MTRPRARQTSLATVPVLRRHLLDGWRGQLGWSLGIAAIIGLYLPLYPSLQTPELTQVIDSLPAELVQALGYDDIASGAGYTQASFFSLLGFVLAVIAGVAWGAAYVAGREETGRLELTLAHAVGRVQYALESTAALIVKMLALGAVAFLVILALNGPSELDLDIGHLVAASAAWVSLGLVSATAALAFGALTGRRVAAIGAGTAVAVLGYGLDAVGRTSADLAALANWSPFHWAFGADPLAAGADWAGLGFLWALNAVFIAIGAWALARRDILG